MSFHSQLLLHKVHQMSFQAKMEDTVRQEIHFNISYMFNIVTQQWNKQACVTMSHPLVLTQVSPDDLIYIY